jgi:hypothetical protein
MDAAAHPKAPAMSPAEFTRALEQELRSRGVPVNPAEVGRMVQDAWPLVRAIPDPPRWARAYRAGEANHGRFLRPVP